MANKHVCELQGKEKAEFLEELRDVVQRIQSLEPRQESRGKPEELPEFLQHRVPRFKPNPDLVPLITHVPIIDIKPTTNAKLLESTDDPKSIYIMMPTPKNPFGSEGANDPLCQEFCDTKNGDQSSQSSSRRSSTQEKPVVFKSGCGGAMIGPGGVPGECDGPTNGVMTCKSGGQHYLCNKNA